MKKICLAVLLFTVGALVFAQTDYFFLVEKPASGSDIGVSLYQTLIAALVTDVDTVSAAAYDDAPSFLFAPIPGNFPGLAELAAGRLARESSGGPASAVSQALALADEQALVWGRPDAVKKLIIISGPLSGGKAENIRAPDTFAEVYYLAFDAPPEQALADIAGPGRFWAIDSVNTPPGDPFLTPGDGLFACIDSIVPKKYKKVSPGAGLTDFSAGAPFFQVQGLVVLARNAAADPVNLLEPQGPAPGAEYYPRPNYTVIRLSRGGKYALENGEALFIAWRGELFFTQINPVYWWLAGVLGIAGLIAVIRVIAARMEKQKAPVFEVVYKKNGQAYSKKPQICIKKDPEEFLQFEPGTAFADIFKVMGPVFPEKELSRFVANGYPRIQYDKKQDAWTIKFNSMDVKKAAVPGKKPKIDLADIDPDNLGNKPAAGAEAESVEPPLDNDIIEVKFKNNAVEFEVENIFKNNSENNVFLVKVNKTEKKSWTTSKKSKRN